MAETQIEFTADDVQLVRETARVWNTAMRQFLGERADWERTGSLARIASALEAEATGPADKGRARLLPGDAPELRAHAKAFRGWSKSADRVQQQRFVEHADRLQDLGDRIAARVGKRRVFTDKDGRRVVVTARGASITSAKRRKRAD
jgi:hypothetical protein